MSPAPHRLALVVGMTSEAKLLAAPARTVIGGGDGAQVEAGLAALHAAAPLTGVLSFGVAGGLDARLAPGALLLADRVVNLGVNYACDAEFLARLRARLPEAHVGALFGAEEAVASVAAKASLHALTGAWAVDMESLAAARFAARQRLPFAALRAIADPAARALPSCALAGLRPDGSADALAVLRGLVKKPGELPALIQIARESGRALAALAAARARLDI